MKTKLISFKFLLAGSLIVTLFVIGNQAHASAAAISQKTDKAAITAYSYVAKPGDNMTYMVRRSVQLYAAAKQIKISSAEAVYCETNVVQKMGGHLLNIGERVDVPFDTLQKYIGSSRRLTHSKKSAWNVYVKQINFDLKRLNPMNKPAAQSAAAVHVISTATKQPRKQSSATQKSKNNNAAFSRAAWIVIALLVIATAYYFTRYKP